MTEMTSAPVPPVTGDDHVRGPAGAPLVIVYADFACPYCALAHARMRDAPIRVVFRHFALRAKHPRAPALAAAAEAAALQGAFWPMHDALYDDPGRTDDPHLWERARRLGLDVARFDEARRSPAVLDRVKRDVRAGLRAGIAATPTLVTDEGVLPGPPDEALIRRLRR